MKKVLSLLASIVVLASSIMIPARHVCAQELPTSQQQSNLTKMNIISPTLTKSDESTFYPFRSSLVAWLATHASESSDVVKGQWKRLFTEELEYGGPGRWADKYYSDYLMFGGGIQSSQGKQMTYDENFSGYFALTLSKNPEFLGELLRDKSLTINNVVATYLENAVEKYPEIEDAIIELTADGSYIGHDRYDKNNELATYNQDINVLSIFANNWDDINDSQKTWCKSYVQYIYDDYCNHHDDGKALAKKVDALYDLMARSEVGAKSDKYQQEFFDYVIGDPSDIENVPYGIGQWLNYAFGITSGHEDEIQTIHDIFNENAHCISGCAKCGEPADFANQLACNITMTTTGKWPAVKTLMTNNSISAEAMDSWKKHYDYIHSGKNEFESISINIGRSAEKRDFHGFDGGGYVAFASASVNYTIQLNNVISPNTSKLSVNNAGGSGSMTLYNAKGERLDGTSGSGHASYPWVTFDMSLPLMQYTAEELEGAYIYVSVGSAQAAKVDNASCKGAYAYAAINSMKLYEKVPDCFMPGKGHEYTTIYKWNDDNTSCVAQATCAKDRSHIIIAHSTAIKHTEDDNNHYYEPVFGKNSEIETKVKVVSKKAIATSEALDLNNPAVISGTTFVQNSSQPQAFYGAGFVLRAGASTSCCILAGSIPENSNKLSFNLTCGEAAITLYYKGEPLMETKVGDPMIESNRNIVMDISRFSSKQIRNMYVSIGMTTGKNLVVDNGPMGKVYVATATAGVNSVVAGY